VERDTHRGGGVAPVLLFSQGHLRVIDP